MSEVDKIHAAEVKNLDFNGSSEKHLAADDDIEIKPAYETDGPGDVPAGEKQRAREDLELIGDDFEDVETKINALPLDRALRIAAELIVIHEHDQNFPLAALDKLKQFVYDPDVTERPEKHEELVREVKLECVLSTDNSPYVEVRANAEATDDPTLVVFTVRVLILGTLFPFIGSFIDNLFQYRFPPVFIGTNVGQLVSYPAGKFLAAVLPDWKINIFGSTLYFNPGPFNVKEHALLTVMCNVSFGASYTTFIIPSQALPFWFNESFAFSKGYQILNTLGTNFVGFGLAGLTRRFLVYPSATLWPATFSNMALIKSFHSKDNNPAVKGPFGHTFRASREKAFLILTGGMFVYFWFPGFLFEALSYFNWMGWIAPSNVNLTAVTDIVSGMGLNPITSFDWNVISSNWTPLTIPTFAIMNQFVGILVGAILAIGVWYGNGWNTGYLPINANGVFDNAGNDYNVSMILDSSGNFDEAGFQSYSEPWMSSGFLLAYFWYFVMYTATVGYVALFQRHAVITGAKALWKSIRGIFNKNAGSSTEEFDLAEDVHYRIMKSYKEVHEWEYMIALIIASVIGMLGVGLYPSETSPVVVVFGIIFSLIVLVPAGLVQATTGIPVPLNVIAEFVGGALVAGNANALMYFKTYGYISAYQALTFSNDLKLAHYFHLPPRASFLGQMWATFIYAWACVVTYGVALGFKNVCTPDADFGMTCANQRTFFAAAVFWGTISPKNLFGPGKRYNLILLGFPIGAILVGVYWLARKRYPRNGFIRQIHPVMLAAGPAYWASPLNMGYFIGNVYVTWFSFQYIRKRYLAFWSKYNYVLAAAFPTGVALASIVIFFGLSIPNGGYTVDWWGNSVSFEECLGSGCPRLPIPDVGYFGKAPGTFVVA